MIGWPTQRPDVPPCPEGWFDDRNKTFLERFLRPDDVVVEIGAWMGASTRWLASKAEHVYTIDHFQGSQEHKADPFSAYKLPTLWETFVVNCWNARDRITPVRADSREGLLALYNRGVHPALVYVDGSHDYDAVVRDVLMTALLWQDAQIVGDDFDWPSVRAAAEDVAKVLRRKLSDNIHCFALPPLAGPSAAPNFG